MMPILDLLALDLDLHALLISYNAALERQGRAVYSIWMASDKLLQFSDQSFPFYVSALKG